MRRAALLALVLTAPVFAQQTRIASDFEIAQMETQAAHETDFAAQLSAHLNLADLRALRNESTLAVREYNQALSIASEERTAARHDGDLRRYATATMYAGFTYAKLRRTDTAAALLDEGIRYAADDARIWNLYAGAMGELAFAAKSEGGARVAVAIAEREAQERPNAERLLSLAVDQFTLAYALSDLRRDDEATALLERIRTTLASKKFDAVRRDITRKEAFEVYSATRSDAAAYLSLSNRVGLKLAAMYEARGSIDAAKKTYQAVLAMRSDDPVALAAMARLSRSKEDVVRSFAEAFDANPFAYATIEDYQKWLRSGGHDAATSDATSTGARMRLALEQMFRGETANARVTLDALAAQFPNNEVVSFLAAKNDVAMGDLARAQSRPITTPWMRESLASEIARARPALPAFLTSKETTATPSVDELRALLAVLTENQLTPEQRGALDRIAVTSVVRFEAGPAAPPNQTIFEVAHAGNVVLKFAEPTAFNGTFAADARLRLTYRILGATVYNAAQVLLVEPLKLEPAP